MDVPLGYTYYSCHHNGNKLTMDLKSVLCESNWEVRSSLLRLQVKALCSLWLGNLLFLLQQDSRTLIKKFCCFDFPSQGIIFFFLCESQSIKKGRWMNG